MHFAQLDGLNAVIVMQVDRQELVAVKNVSPLIVGIGDDATYIASDVVALLEYTDRVVYLDDRQVATMTPGSGSSFPGSMTGAPLAGARGARDVAAGRCRRRRLPGLHVQGDSGATRDHRAPRG